MSSHFRPTVIAPQGFKVRCIESDDATDDETYTGAQGLVDALDAHAAGCVHEDAGLKTARAALARHAAMHQADERQFEPDPLLDEDDDEEAGDLAGGSTKSGPGTGQLTDDLLPDSPPWDKATTKIKMPARGRESARKKVNLRISTPLAGFRVEADPLRESLRHIANDAAALANEAKVARRRAVGDASFDVDALEK